MKNVLAIYTSLNQAEGNSSKLLELFLEKYQEQHLAKVSKLDLQSLNLPHLSGSEMQSWMTPADERTQEQVALAANSDNAVEQLLASDVLLIGLPMYNFGVPSTFKAWIDRVARAGVTFRYTEQGPEGLVTGKKAIVLAARGGMYAGTPRDSQTQYIKDVLAFLGITDVEFVYVEGLAMGPETAEIAWQKGNQKIIELIAKVGA